MTQSVLRRMVAQRAAVASAPVEAAETSLALALMQVAQMQHGLGVTARDLGVDVPPDAAPVSDMGAGALFLLVKGGGICALPSGFVGTLVVFALTGILPAGAPEPRAPTRVDYEMLRAFVDAVLGGAGFDEARIDGFLTDPRVVRFAMGQGPFLRHRLSAEFENGTEEQIEILLPDRSRDADPEPAGAEVAPSGGDLAALGCSVEMEAILSRFRAPVSAVSNWAVGDTIALSGADIGDVALETFGHAPVMHGRLGRWRGDRAIRIASADGANAIGDDLAGVQTENAPAPDVAPGRAIAT